MLAATARLRRSSEFTATIRRGRRAARGALVVHVVARQTVMPEPIAPSITEPAPSRAGFVVPKAVGTAVVRNRVKRQLRHLVRERLAGLPPGTDLVVRALPGASTRGYRRLAADLDAALAAAARPRKADPS